MTARERILALKYFEKQNRDLDFAKQLGVEVTLDKTYNPKKNKKKGGKCKHEKNSQ